MIAGGVDAIGRLVIPSQIGEATSWGRSTGPPPGPARMTCLLSLQTDDSPVIDGVPRRYWCRPATWPSPGHVAYQARRVDPFAGQVGLTHDLARAIDGAGKTVRPAEGAEVLRHAVGGWVRNA